ncbi:MAG: hypothetical protein WCO44_07425 [Bacteroidota bacterium]
MESKQTISGITLAQVNVEIINLKQEMVIHKTGNRKDFENLQTAAKKNFLDEEKCRQRL